MKHVFSLYLLLFLVACQKKEAPTNKEVKSNETCKQSKTSAPDEGFEMYQMSEMASLMEQMYVDNKRLRERIIKGDTVGSFPAHFLKIYSATMTDPEDNDAFFKSQAKAFIAAQQKIYSDPKNAKVHFNAGIDACVQCHQQKCGGPLVRIKKLYIK